jgi:O-antigen biosynthesis protein
MINRHFRMITSSLKNEGFRATAQKVRNKLTRAKANGLSIVETLKMPKVDVLSFYDFVNFVTPIVDQPPTQVDSKICNWIIPDFGIGSGGHLNIFRFIRMLELNGYTCNISIFGPHRHNSAYAAKRMINEHFFALNANVYLEVHDLPDAEFTFATSWVTAYALKKFARTAYKLYFVQDFEAWFYSHGSEYAFAENTYKLGFIGVCAGDWLKKKLGSEYGMQCYSVGFSYDRNVYLQTPRREPEISRVFCYCRPPTTRRGLEMAFLTLDLVAKQCPQTNFIFAGWDMSSYSFPHPHLNAGLLTVNELPDLYSQCDAALVLSFTNLSLLPLELMACGCAVVSNNGEQVDWILNDANSVLCDPTPQALADGLIRVLTDNEFRTKLTRHAKSFAQSTRWEDEGCKLISILDKVKQ